jgi:hypothetical protein
MNHDVIEATRRFMNSMPTTIEPADFAAALSVMIKLIAATSDWTDENVAEFCGVVTAMSMRDDPVTKH